MEWTILAFAFPAKADTHLPTQGGADLHLVRYQLTLWGHVYTVSISCDVPVYSPAFTATSLLSL